MRIVERACDRPQQADDTQRVVTHTRTEHLIQGLAGDHLGHQVWAVAVVGKLVQARDGWMLERDVGAELEQESPREAHVARDGRLDGAQRNPALHARVLRLVDHSEALSLDLADNTVAADQTTVLVRVGFGPGAVPATAL